MNSVSRSREFTRSALELTFALEILRIRSGILAGVRSQSIHAYLRLIDSSMLQFPFIGLEETSIRIENWIQVTSIGFPR